MPTLPRAAVYARSRVSGPGGVQNPQSEALAAAEQITVCRAYTAAHGMDVVDEYVDLGVGVRDKRPEYDRLIADLDTGRLDVIIIEGPDRVARSLRERDALQERCEAVGCQVHLANPGCPWDDDAKIFASIGAFGS
ncbi:recombinase family protein [Actinoplanes sp. NPDC049802]|uniref:recombinase family protein n=1 Tax=Actinoplanes sp. NPDC049802 TaxID=3154742 RepID=UPI00340D5F8C